MWALRLLSGPKSGQIFQLKNGTNIVGRGPQCEVKLPSSGVSKEHAKVDVLDDKVIIADLNSRNGTFVNGIQVKSQKLKTGDKLAFHDMLMEVHHLTATQLAQYQAFAARLKRPSSPSSPAYDANVAYQAPPVPNMNSYAPPAGEAAPAEEGEAVVKLNVVALAKAYFENVVLPGVYRLPEIFEFRIVLMGFMAAFILVTTALSSIPLMTILKTSIERESQRRALTIARTLAQINRPALLQHIDSALSIEIAVREPGVEKALIISQADGNVIAPSSQAGTFPDLPFVHEARRLEKETVEQISSSKIGASVPIEFFNSDTGTNQIGAYAMIIYDMGTLAVDDGRTLSLFIQTFAIALILGSILFFFMYKVIENPLVQLNRQLDVALREGQQNVETTYLFPALTQLTSNINSALHRVGSQQENTPSGDQERDRHTEMSNLVEMMGFAAFAVAAHNMSIAAVNQAFEQRASVQAQDILHGSIEKLTDQALKLSILDLIHRLSQNPDQLSSNDLEFSGQNYQIAGQAIYGSKKVAYFLFAILPVEGGS
jgi:hypothetical protein